jgi:tRNA(fMet)-specific endonuclease VapC
MLDTNIVIYTIKNRPDKVRHAVNLHARELCISAITYSELVYGANRSSQPARNLADVEGFVANLEVLAIDEGGAAHGGEIRADLAARGRPIGVYDSLIAGHARSRGLILVTNNTNDFRSVRGLRLENWAR